MIEALEALSKKADEVEKEAVSLKNQIEIAVSHLKEISELDVKAEWRIFQAVCVAKQGLLKVESARKRTIATN